MIASVRQALDSFFGARDAAVTVPPMDGALQPNNRLETADLFCAAEAPDNLVRLGEAILFSSGSRIMALGEDGSAQLWRDCGAPVSAMAAGPGGRLAVGLAGEGLLVIDPAGAERRIGRDAFPGAGCITALAFDGAGDLWLTSGSVTEAPQDWSRNLMSRKRDGALWHLPAATLPAKQIAGGLAWPSGLLPDQGRLLISEAWANRIIALPVTGGPAQVLLDRLPAYPGRLSRAGDDIWLCCFAPRSQLVEFVLREKQFRQQMMAEVEPAFWIAPALRSGQSFREPLQGGAVKQLGMLKPWAPTRSYGLLVRLGADLRPLDSFHSRADGRRHGVTACLAHGPDLFVCAQGGDALLRLTPRPIRNGAPR